ncbi:hypothetical protein [Herbaspirillum sp.]|nr:hypothetical protein [Herbaspirillum sp.]
MAGESCGARAKADGNQGPAAMAAASPRQSKARRQNGMPARLL